MLKQTENIVKRILAFALCALLLCGAIPFSALALPAEDAVTAAEDTEDPVDIPEIEIYHYVEVLKVEVLSDLVFHVAEVPPEGYEIVWSNGDVGPECRIREVRKRKLTVSAKLVRTSDGEVVGSTHEETVKVKRDLFTYLFVLLGRTMIGTGYSFSYVDNQRIIVRWGSALL